MEVFRPNRKNSKIYKKIDYIKLLIIFIISFIIFTLFFYYIGKEQNLDTSIYTSLIIAGLIGLGSIISDLVGNRARIFVENKDELGYIEIHREIVGGTFLKDGEFDEIVAKYDAEEIYKESQKYEGIDKGIIKKVLSIKKKFNKTIIKADVHVKEWKSSSIVTISKVYTKDKDCKKKIVIPNDLDNYEKLLKKLKKMM